MFAVFCLLVNLSLLNSIFVLFLQLTRLSTKKTINNSFRFSFVYQSNANRSDGREREKDLSEVEKRDFLPFHPWLWIYGDL